MKNSGSLCGFLKVLMSLALMSFASVAGLWGCQCVWGGDVEEPEGRVTFLDVGQGLSVLLEYGGRFALYDAGPDSAGLVDTLRNRGVDSLEWVLLSHNHRDHLGGLLELLAGSSRGGSAIRIGKLYVGPDTSGGALVDSVLRGARRRNIPVDTLYRGEEVSLGTGAAGGIRLDCLWPVQFLKVGENRASVVVREAAGAFLLTGDLDSLGEVRLMEIASDVSAELLQVGHHGSAHSSTLRFLAAVSPRHAVISVGARNRYGHPAEPVLRKLQYVLGVATDVAADSATQIYRTDLHGSVPFLLVPGVGVVPGTP